MPLQSPAMLLICRNTEGPLSISWHRSEFGEDRQSQLTVFLLANATQHVSCGFNHGIKHAIAQISHEMRAIETQHDSFTPISRLSEEETGSARNHSEHSTWHKLILKALYKRLIDITLCVPIHFFNVIFRRDTGIAKWRIHQDHVVSLLADVHKREPLYCIISEQTTLKWLPIFRLSRIQF